MRPEHSFSETSIRVPNHARGRQLFWKEGSLSHLPAGKQGSGPCGLSHQPPATSRRTQPTVLGSVAHYVLGKKAASCSERIYIGYRLREGAGGAGNGEGGQSWHRAQSVRDRWVLLLSAGVLAPGGQLLDAWGWTHGGLGCLWELARGGYNRLTTPVSLSPPPAV